MSIVVFHNGILAGDSLVTQGDMIIGSAPKVFETEWGAWGAVGPLELIDKAKKWATHRTKPDEINTPEFDLISVECYDDKLNVWHFCDEGKCQYDPMKGIAIGSGAPVAYGALQLGASAVEAVEAACNVMVNCGGPIVSFDLNEHMGG